MKNVFNCNGEYSPLNPLEQKLIVSVAFLLGIIIGFWFSPVKKGIYCGNHNGSGNTYPEKEAGKRGKSKE